MLVTTVSLETINNLIKEVERIKKELEALRSGIEIILNFKEKNGENEDCSEDWLYIDED